MNDRAQLLGRFPVNPQSFILSIPEERMELMNANAQEERIDGETGCHLG